MSQPYFYILYAAGNQVTGPSHFNVYADIAAEAPAPAKEAVAEAAKAVGESFICCKVCMNCAYPAPSWSHLAAALATTANSKASACQSMLACMPQAYLFLCIFSNDDRLLFRLAAALHYALECMTDRLHVRSGMQCQHMCQLTQMSKLFNLSSNYGQVFAM